MNRKLKTFASALPAFAALLAALVSAPAAHAQLTLTLTPAGQAGPVPNTFYFIGTLSNPTANEVFLNGDSPTFNGPTGSPGLDDNPFFNNAPLSLMAAGSTDSNGNPTDSFTGEFFDVTVDSSAAQGTYEGTFAILGGADANAQDTVATEDFSVTVTPSSAPEPSQWAAFGVGVLGLAGLALRARRRRLLS
jgi:MYXO-CTERM domain-containing protein